MAHRNCFGNVSDNLHSSDYISRKKSKTIYKNAVNLAKQGGVSHKKTSLGQNKGTYVGNIYISKDKKCLIGAKDYDSLLSVTNGKYLVSPNTLDIRSKQDLWAGSIYTMDMSGVTSIVAYPDGSGNTFIYPPDITANQTYPINIPPDEQGLIVDPSYNIFYKADITQSARGVCYLKNERAYKQYLQCLPYTQDIAKTYLEVSNGYVGEYFYPKNFVFDCPDESWKLNVSHCGERGIVRFNSNSMPIISGTGTFLNSHWTGAGSPTSFKIDGFTSIASGSLTNQGNNLGNITNVVIGNSVTTIENIALSGCTALTSVIIGNSVATIGKAAFIHCTALSEITIPASVKIILDGAFEDCTALTTVTFETGSEPSSMSSITFYDLNAITVFMNGGTLGYLNSHYSLSLSFAPGQSFFGATDVTISEL